MYVALPDSGVDMNALAARLEHAWPASLSGISSRDVHVVLPRFHVDPQLDLQDALESLGPPPIEFVVDRPFVFLLCDEATGTDLFVGRIAHP